MNKSDAIQLLGGSVATAATAIGTSYQAVSKWPDVLPRRIEDRVIAAIARKRLPPEAFCPESDAAKVTRGDLRPGDAHLIWPDLPEPRENPYPTSTNETEAAHG